ncbi:MAG: hypothetical protein HY753_03265 [Nitrospirae bacterium]|nr:hypothetical protein [Nitrospirota bacterium]
MHDSQLFSIHSIKPEPASQKSAIEEILGIPFTENNHVRLLNFIFLKTMIQAKDSPTSSKKKLSRE